MKALAPCYRRAIAMSRAAAIQTDGTKQQDYKFKKLLSQDDCKAAVR
jgi:hypothetical protein